MKVRASVGSGAQAYWSYDAGEGDVPCRAVVTTSEDLGDCYSSPTGDVTGDAIPTFATSWRLCK
jgi:hypothetical protein